MTTPPCSGYCTGCGQPCGMTTPQGVTTPLPQGMTTPLQRVTTPRDDHPSKSDHPSLINPPILVTTEIAALHAGRPVRTIYRWATERRLTRHGTPGKGNARWNLREIPGWSPSSGRPQPPPPPVL